MANATTSKDMAEPETVVEVADESITSLTGDLDYEPELEFDDTELEPPSRPKSRQFNVSSREFLQELYFSDEDESLPPLPPPYRTIGINALLISKKVVEVFGDDNFGRRIIVFSACRIPDTTIVTSDKLLQYIISALDNYVEQDYTLIYFHYGLSPSNRPPFTWYWNAYKQFDRKYKKNLKALYIVHPTKVVKTVWALLRPLLGIKFGRKMNYFNYLHELHQHININSINIPNEVIEYNNRMLALNPKAGNVAVAGSSAGPYRKISNTCEFGVTLNFIQQNNPKCKDSIPPIMRSCVEYLTQADALDTEGIFRRSCRNNWFGEIQEILRSGKEFEFPTPHAAAMSLKKFLRELKEPLLTCALYDDIVTFMEWPVKKRLQRVTTMIMEQVPFENYLVLKYLLEFLEKVKDRACLNKMNGSNLSIVFGPNLVWPAVGFPSMDHARAINEFINFLLEHHKGVFIITSIE